MFSRFAFIAIIALLSCATARAESPYVKFLKSGRVPPERMGAVLSLIAKNGDADDLRYVLEQTTAADGFPAEVKPAALDTLWEAATTRNIKPSGDLTVLKSLLTGDASAASKLTALKLVGLWKVTELGSDIEALAVNPKTPPAVRKAALTSLGGLGGDAARATFIKLAAPGNPLDARILAVAGLAQFDTPAAAKEAVSVLTAMTENDDPAALIDAFLAQQDGVATLAAALADAKIPADAAKLALRHMYSIGRTDEALINILSSAAGISTEVPPLNDQELKALVAEVNAHGDAARGELLFRRHDLSCMKCHAVSGAGGNIGPDLSPLGQSSPVDYVITSILTPELSVKEEYQLAKVLTSEGKLHVGIVVEDNPERIILKDAEGGRVTIPKDDAEEVIRGGSLMPKGLANFLTHGELLDLVKFVSELGKPGGNYPVRTLPTVQRWRVLTEVPEKLALEVPKVDTFQAEVLSAHSWLPAYGKVNGDLPLAELVKQCGSTTLYLQAEVDVTTAGNVSVEVAAGASGITAWMDEESLVLVDGRATIKLEPGRRQLTLRVDTLLHAGPAIKVLVRPGAVEPAEYTVVGGP
jgi:putative heme-binding domain-containing protein